MSESDQAASTEEAATVVVPDDAQTVEPVAPETPAEEPTKGHDAGMKHSPPPEWSKEHPDNKGAKSKAPRKTRSEKFAEAGEKNRAKEKEVKASKGTDKPKRVTDPELRTAHEATALATGGSVSKDGVLTLGQIKFGAAVNTTQVKMVRETLKGKNVLQYLGNVPESKLRAYAKGEAKQADLPDDTKARLKEMVASYPRESKMWARKAAVIALTIHTERKKSDRAKDKAKSAA